MDRPPTSTPASDDHHGAGTNADSPARAGHHDASGLVKRYRRPELTVVWEPSRCLHTLACVRTLPLVFDVDRRPWVDVDAADATAIAAAIERCPSGALRYERPAGMPSEEPARPTEVAIEPFGPLYVRGEVVLRSREGESAHTRVALCRCGNSLNAPFCDNSHRASSGAG